MRRKSAGGRPRPLRVLRGGKANCSRFHCSSVRSVGYKVVFCILPYSKPRLDIRCPRTQKDQKMIFQTRSKGPGLDKIGCYHAKRNLKQKSSPELPTAQYSS